MGLLISACDSETFLNGVGRDASEEFHCDISHKGEAFGDVNMSTLKENSN